MRDIANAGNVAVTLRQGESIALLDENGEPIAIFAPRPKQRWRMHVFIRAPKSIRILRERDGDE